MIFGDSIASVNNIISYGRMDVGLREDHDPEVERLFSSSPDILEQCRQYESTRQIGKRNISNDVSKKAIFLPFIYCIR